MSQAKENDTVQVHYTGRTKDGEIFDSSVDREPLEFTIGNGMLLKDFEQGVMGMQVGEKKTIDITAENGYGMKNDSLVQQVPREVLPAEIKPEVGMGLVSEQPDGSRVNVVITAVDETTITVDANHPLAGEDLTFEIELVQIL